MNTLTPQQTEELTLQRKKTRRAFAQGRRWYLRGVLMFIIALVAGYRGGQLNYVIAIAMVVLSGLCFSLGRSMRRQARAMEQKIALMEGSKGVGGVRE